MGRSRRAVQEALCPAPQAHSGGGARGRLQRGFDAGDQHVFRIGLAQQHGHAGALGVVPVAVVGVVLGIYYYFGWIKAAFFPAATVGEGDDVNPRPARTPVRLATSLALGAVALSTVILGFYQGGLGHWLTMR